MKERRWLVVLIPAAALAIFFGISPLALLLSLMVCHVLHSGALALGLVFAGGGAAGVVVSLLVARLARSPKRVAVLWSVYAAGGAAIALVSLVPNVWGLGVVTAIEVGLILYGDVLWVATMQELVPGEILGRVSSLVYLFAFSLGPLGILAGGGAGAALGTKTALVVSGIVSGAICLLVLVIPGVRDPERDPATR